MMWLLFYNDLLWPDLDIDLFKYGFVLMLSLLTYTQHFGECNLFAARLTDPRAQKLKTFHRDHWPDLDLTHDINLKTLSMDEVHLDESFQTPPRPPH